MILITGGAGFIGSYLIKALDALSIADQIIVLDPAKLEGINSNHGRVLYYTGRTNDINLLRNIFGNHKVEVVIHLGMSSSVKEVEQDLNDSKKSIVDGTSNLIEVMSSFNIKRIIHASSSMVYGNFSKEIIDESEECNPVNSYGKFKLAAEKLIFQSDLDFTIFRPTAVYGLGDKKMRVVANLVDKASEGETLHLSSLDTRLDFTYIDDLIDFVTKLINSKMSVRKIYNVSRGQSRSLFELVEIVKRYYPDLKYIVQDSDGRYPQRGEYDLTKIKKELGFSPRWGLEDGLAKMIGDINNGD